MPGDKNGARGGRDNIEWEKRTKKKRKSELGVGGRICIGNSEM
jgi:hypothetical protein